MGFPTAHLFFGFNFHADDPQCTAPLHDRGEAPKPRVPCWAPAGDGCPFGVLEGQDISPCEVVTSGEEFCRVFSLAVKESMREVGNWEIGASAIEMPPTFRVRWVNALHAVSERLGIPWVEPGWHLVINNT